MKRVTPFLYQDLVDRILSAERDWPRLLIQAGRGLGKSSLIKHLGEELESLQIDVEEVNRLTPDPEGVIANWATAPEGVLLIDDLDRLFNRSLEESLVSFGEEAEGEWRVIATACRLEDMEENRGLFGSTSINTFHLEKLDPWEFPGQAAGAIKDALPYLRALHQRYRPDHRPHPMLTSEAPDLAEAWVDVITSVTEGLPSLVGASFDALARLLFRHLELPSVDRGLLALPDTSSKLRLWKDSVRRYLADQIYDSLEGMGVAQKAIYYFQQNSLDFEALVKLAQAAQGLDIADTRLRRSLKRSGLVYRHPRTGRLKVAGALTCQRILEIAGLKWEDPADRGISGRADPSQQLAARQTFRISLQPGNEPDEGGKLIVHDPPGLSSLDLKGSEWTVLRAISEVSGGDTVPVEAIRESTQLASAAAVRSALQRLRDKLRQHDLGDLIETVRGKGFRLSRKE